MSEQLQNVLLVDDEPRLLSSLRRRLSSSFNILTAEGGHEALQLLSTRSDVKVIVADMQMPEMNGIELLKAVKQAHPALRRIMLTGNSDQETAIAAINEGQVMRFLRKPCDAGELAVVLRQAIEEYDFAANEVPDLAEEQTIDPDAARLTLHRVMRKELDHQLGQLINSSSQLDVPPEQLEAADLAPCLTDVRRKGEDMLWLVDYMMKLSHLKAARATNRMARKFDLMGALRAELENLRGLAHAKSLTISFNSLRKTVEVIGLEGEVRLLIGELLHNAISYNDNGGHISMIVNTERDQAAVRIFSTGGCIAPDQLRQGLGAWDADGPRNSAGREELRLKMMVALANINDARCQIQPYDTGGMVSFLCLKRDMAQGSQLTPAAVA